MIARWLSNTENYVKKTFFFLVELFQSALEKRHLGQGQNCMTTSICYIAFCAWNAVLQRFNI